MLFSSHNTHDIEQLADSITFLHQGRVIASEDKEHFLDSWRRMVCQSDADFDRQAFPEVAMVRRNGSMLELKIKGFSEELAPRLEARGLAIKSSHAMSLEDIFVTTVRAGVAA